MRPPESNRTGSRLEGQVMKKKKMLGWYRLGKEQALGVRPNSADVGCNLASKPAQHGRVVFLPWLFAALGLADRTRAVLSGCIILA